MAVVELAEDNLEQYADFVGMEDIENIGREYYRGVVITDDKDDPLSAGIWELIHADKEEMDTQARIVCLKAKNDAEADKLLETCTLMFVNEDVKHSFFEMPVGKKGIKREILKNAGYEIKEAESSEIVCTIKDLLEMPPVRAGRPPSYVQELGNLMIRPFRRGVMDCVFRSNRELMEDLRSIPMSWFEQRVSGYVEIDGRVRGFLLLHKTPAGRLKVEVFTALGNDVKKDLLHLMIFSLKQAEKYYDPDTQVVIRRTDEDVKNLTDYILPDVKGAKVLYGERAG